MRLNDINVRYVGKYDMFFPSRWYNCCEVPEPRRADINSKFKIVYDLKYAYYHNERLPIRPIITSETYYIDDVVVDEKTWVDVFKIISDNIQAITGKVLKRLIKAESDDTVIWSFVTDDLQGKQTDWCYFDEIFDDFLKWNDNTWMGSSKKEIDDMMNRTHKKIMEEYSKAVDNHFMIRPQIVDYKYIAENGVTIIKWSDSTSTTVTCDPKTADQYTGFVTAIAKKAFGNGGKMLSEWDRLVIKPIEDAKKAEKKAKIEAEKKAKEDKIHAEAKAKRDAKKAKRKKQREIEKLAKQIADEYYAQELTEEAEKLAVKKYGVPKSYLDGYDHEYGCECGCKEFDNLNTEDISD